MIKSINADKAGFVASTLCAIHCAGIPVLISSGLLSTTTWLHNHAIDWAIISFGIIVASYALVGDYFNKHKNPKPLIFASIGFMGLFVGMIDHHGWMLAFSVIGGLMVATAHYINIRLSHSCASNN